MYGSSSVHGVGRKFSHRDPSRPAADEPQAHARDIQADPVHERFNEAGIPGIIKLHRGAAFRPYSANWKVRASRSPRTLPSPRTSALLPRAWRRTISIWNSRMRAIVAGGEERIGVVFGMMCGMPMLSMSTSVSACKGSCPPASSSPGEQSRREHGAQPKAARRFGRRARDRTKKRQGPAHGRT